MIKLRQTTLAALAALAGALILFVSLEFAFPEQLQKQVLLDFDVFHLVGTMIFEGNLSDAYDADAFLARQQELSSYNEGMLFWSYPPPYNLVVAGMSFAPIWLAYLGFMSLSLAAYLLILKRLSGTEFHTVLILMLGLFPVIIRSGQNSFVTGALIGLTCLLALRRSSWAGVPLGLMVIKPHLALGVGLWSLLDRRWDLAALSLATATAVCALATFVFGVEVWSWFFSGIAKTGQSFQAGEFRLFRMTSMYAFGLSVGFDAQFAMALHIAVAVLALCTLALFRRKSVSTRTFAGLGVFVSALLSPYNFDYDLAMLAFAACLVLEPIKRHATKPEKWGLFAAIWVVELYGLVISFIMKPSLLADGFLPISIGGPILVCIGVCLVVIIRRDIVATKISKAK